MARSRGGLIALVCGIVCLAAGFALGISSVFPLMSQFEPLLQLQSPGSSEVTIENAGTFTLWHDHRTSFHGKSVNNAAALPSEFSFLLTPQGGSEAIGLDPIRTHTTVSFGSRESVGIGTFAVPVAGSYTLTIDNPAQDARVFSLTQGDLMQGMAQFGLRLVLGLIVGVGGLVLLVLGIVFMVRGRKPTATPGSPAAASPPPPLPPVSG